MTIFGTIGNAFATTDRIATGIIRLGSPGYGREMMLPIPVGQAVQLADKDGRTQLISYSDIIGEYDTAFGIWSKLTRTLATTDIIVEGKASNGRWTRASDTSLEDRMRNPAPGKGLVDLLTWAFSPYFGEGNSLLAPYQPDGPASTPAAIIPIDWRYMSAHAMPGGPVELWISNQLGDARELYPEEVLHFAWPSPTNSPIGLCPLQAAGTAVRLRNSADRFQIASFDNGSRPLGVFVLPENSQMDEESRKTLREKAEANHKGVDNAFKIGVLSGGVTWEKMSFSAVEAEIDRTRTSSDGALYRTYDVRRGCIEDSETGTQGVAVERNRDFARSLIPHARTFENVLHAQLIRRVSDWKDLRVRLDLAELQRGTYREEVEVSVYGMTGGVYSEDEARERIGLPPSGNEGADKPRVPHAQLDPSDGRRLPPSTETDPGRSTRPTTGTPEVPAGQ